MANTVLGGKGIDELVEVMAVLKTGNDPVLMNMMTNGDADAAQVQPWQLVRTDRHLHSLKGRRR